MSDHYWLTEHQFECIKPYFPRPHGKPRVDDRRVISGIIHVIRIGLRWRDAPQVYGPHKTLYNRFVRWSRMGVFDRIFGGLVAGSDEPDIVMIDATHLKTHRTAASLLKKGAAPHRIGRTKGGLNPKLHALFDDKGRPLVLCLSEGHLLDQSMSPDPRAGLYFGSGLGGNVRR
jgi:transposase